MLFRNAAAVMPAYFLKNPRELRVVLEAKQLGDFLDLQIGSDKKILGL